MDNNIQMHDDCLAFWLNEMQDIDSDLEFYEVLKVFLAVYLLAVEYFETGACCFPILGLLQLFCNRREDPQLVKYVFEEVAATDPLILYEVLLRCFVGTTPHYFIGPNLPLLPYLMEAGQNARIMIDDQKFGACFPLESTIIKWTEAECYSLRVFLKFGGGFDMSRENFLRVLGNMLHHLVEACTSSGLWDPVTLRKLDEPNHPVNLEAINKVNRLKSCFKMLLNETHNPYTICSERVLTEVSLTPDMPRGETLLQFYDSLYPNQNYGKNHAPSLKHICRVAIRKQLHGNYSLPSGIDDLELPQTLKSYLSDLTED